MIGILVLVRFGVFSNLVYTTFMFLFPSPLFIDILFASTGTGIIFLAYYITVNLEEVFIHNNTHLCYHTSHKFCLLEVCYRADRSLGIY